MVNEYGGRSVEESTQKVDSRLYRLSRRAELHYLTVQVGRVAKAELDTYRKAEDTYNA